MHCPVLYQWSVHPLYYSTQFTHQSILIWPSLIRAIDAQLFISFSPNSFSESIDHLLHVVKQISSWLTSNFLCLNPSKTEFILIGLREQLKKTSDPSISLNLDSTLTHTFTPTSPVGNLGVIFDQSLSFSDHITHLSRSCFMHIRDVWRICPTLDLKAASTIATSIVHAKLDYSTLWSWT